MKRIGIVVGEVSGDLLGSQLMAAIRKKYPDVLFYGLGGPAMIASGFNTKADLERLSVMGLLEPLKRLPDLFKLRRELIHHFTTHKPDIFIGIDAPDFNLGLESKLKKMGIPIIHYVSPSVWAWRKGRIKKISQTVDLMLTLLPFEADFYRENNVPVKYTGHPLANQIPVEIDKRCAKQHLKLDENKIYIAILPGSRRQELIYMAPIFLRAALKLSQKYPEIGFISPCVNELRFQEWKKYCDAIAPNLLIHSVIGNAHNVLAAADLAMVTSGTATLECMLYKTPMIIAYRMSHFAFRIVKWLVRVPFIGLPNLLAHKLIVPEFIQNEATPDNIMRSLDHYLMHAEKKQELIATFARLHEQLRVPAQDVLLEAIQFVSESHA